MSEMARENMKSKQRAKGCIFSFWDNHSTPQRAESMTGIVGTCEAHSLGMLTYDIPWILIIFHFCCKFGDEICSFRCHSHWYRIFLFYWIISSLAVASDNVLCDLITFQCFMTMGES